MKSSARVIVMLFAIVAIVIILLVFSQKSKERARKTLVEDYAAEITEIEMPARDPEAGDGKEVRMIRQLVVGCSSEKLVDLREFGSLMAKVGQPTVLDLTGAPNLQSFQGVEQMSGLESLVAIDCPKLVSAEGVAGHTGLRELVFTDSQAFADASAVKGLPNLDTLDFSGCEALSGVDVSGLSGLKNLYLSRCRNLKVLNVGALSGLLQLYLDGCGGLETLEGLSHLTSLTDLDLSNASSLTQIDGVEELKSLIVLDIRNVALEDFSGIGKLPTLRVLRMGGQDSLETLEPFTHMESLREIHLEACANFRSLKGLPPNVSQYAGFTYCPKLTSLEGVEVATSLEQLDMTGCENLKDISALASLENLIQLSLVKCRQVTDISVIEGLDKLLIAMMGGSGVPPATTEDFEPANKDLILDFTISE
ncbi:MAG: hypothetical protein CMO55_16730 [Verrucomicrobiales bacterium]|nr:hypothetical protein [Verrucomicrobiales bacterium]